MALKVSCYLGLLIGLTCVLAGRADMVEPLVTHGVVPDVIPDAPQGLLKITYTHDNQEFTVDGGAELTPSQVRAEPKVKWTPEPNAYYTLIMTDPDAPSRAEPKFREFNHWLVGNILANAVDKGDVITAYVGSGPPKGTGLHRYVFLLYKQPGLIEFEEERVPNTSRTNRPKFSAVKFAKKYNLGEPVAANFYQAQWDDYVPTVHRQLSLSN